MISALFLAAMLAEPEAPPKPPEPPPVSCSVYCRNELLECLTQSQGGCKSVECLVYMYGRCGDQNDWCLARCGAARAKP